MFDISPSILMNLYLLLTAIFDISRVRTLWLVPGPVSGTGYGGVNRISCKDTIDTCRVEDEGEDPCEQP